MSRTPNDGVSSEPLKYKTWVLKVFIHCENCKKKVKKILHRIEGVYTAVVDSEHQKVVVTGNVDGETLIKKLAKSGKLAEILPESFDKKEKKSSKLKKETGGEAANPGQARKKPKEKTEKVAPSGGKPEEKGGGGGGSGGSEAAGAQPSTGGRNGGAKKMKKRKGGNKGADVAGDQTGGTGTTTPVFQNINQLPPTTYYYPIPAYEMSYYNTTYPSTSSGFSHYYDQPLESRIDHRSTHDPIHASDYGYEDDDDSGCYIM